MNLDIEPYYKKPKIKRFEMVPLDNLRLSKAMFKDTLWMVETALNPMSLSMNLRHQL